MRISERIKKLRKHHKLTQTEFGQKIGVSMRTVQSWEQDKSKPSIEKANGIAKTFNISLDWLLNAQGKMLVELPNRPIEDIQEWITNLPEEMTIWFEIEFPKRFPEYK